MIAASQICSPNSKLPSGQYSCLTCEEPLAQGMALLHQLPPDDLHQCNASSRDLTSRPPKENHQE